MLLRQKEQRRNRQSPSAERRLDFGLDQRPRVRKSLFGHIFAVNKEDITGMETSPAHRRDELFRFGAMRLGWTEPALKRFLKTWIKSGGVAIL